MATAITPGGFPIRRKRIDRAMPHTNANYPARRGEIVERIVNGVGDRPLGHPGSAHKLHALVHLDRDGVFNDLNMRGFSFDEGARTVNRSHIQVGRGSPEG